MLAQRVLVRRRQVHKVNDSFPCGSFTITALPGAISPPHPKDVVNVNLVDLATFI